MSEGSGRMAVFSMSQLLAAMAVSASTFCIGSALGYTSPALPLMMDRNITDFEVTKQQGSWVGGIMPLAGIVGSIIGGPLMSFGGRKVTILISAVPFIVSWLLIGFANSIKLILVGRFFTGIAMGIASISLPVYIGEAIHPHIRGTFGIMMTLWCTFGLLMCFAIGSITSWDQLAFVNGALCLPYLIMFLLVPESPRWLASKGEMDKAKVALIWLRRKDADISDELKEMMSSQTDPNARTNLCKEAFQRKYLKAIIVALGLFLFQQTCGINAIFFYTVMIFDLAGGAVDSYACTIAVGIVNFLVTFITTLIIDHTGRKLLLYISSVVMAINLAILAVFFYCKSIGKDTSSFGWLPLICMVIYVLGFALGYGPVPWLMLGEILPSRIRGPGAAFVVGFNWICTFLVTKSFHDMIDAIGVHGAFFLFSGCSLVAFFFTLFLVPETKNKSLEEIEAELTGEAVT